MQLIWVRMAMTWVICVAYMLVQFPANSGVPFRTFGLGI